MFLECIEGLRLQSVDTVFILNGVFDAGTYYLQELILIEVCVDASRNFGHQYNQQEAEELNESKKKNSVRMSCYPRFEYTISRVRLSECEWCQMTTYRDQHALRFLQCAAASQESNDDNERGHANEYQQTDVNITFPLSK